MEQPDTWIVCDHSESGRAHGSDLDDISTHRIELAFDEGWIQSRVARCVVLSAMDEHGSVAVDMAVGA
jgi:hypothetical protein